MAVPCEWTWEGNVAVVTGGSAGIGQAISRGLARCGAAVDYRKSAAEAGAAVTAIEAEGGRACTADIGDEAQVGVLMKRAVAGPVRLLRASPRCTAAR